MQTELYSPGPCWLCSSHGLTVEGLLKMKNLLVKLGILLELLQHNSIVSQDGKPICVQRDFVKRPLCPPQATLPQADLFAPLRSFAIVLLFAPPAACGFYRIERQNTCHTSRLWLPPHNWADGSGLRRGLH